MVLSNAFKYAMLWLTFFVLLSCSSIEKQQSSSIDVLKIKPSVEKEIETEKIKEKQKVLILLSSQNPSYQQLADVISKKFNQPATQITLSGKPEHERNVLLEISQTDDLTHIVALGLNAAKLVKDIKNRRVIFAQVFNYQDAELIADNMKGVSDLPSPEKLFKDWKALAPGLSSVAIIAGQNLDVYLLRAQEAAKSQNIKLFIQQVATDKEFIYMSKGLNPNIEGQWILPDNRILSGRALKEVMAYASRRGRQMVVFTPKLLPFGGLFSVTQNIDSIAQGVLQRIEESADKTIIPGQAILPVMDHNMVINRNIVVQLNLHIPQEYQAYVNGE